MAEELGNDQLPMADIFGDWDDVQEAQGDLRRQDVDEYTPETFDQYLTAEIITDRGGDILRGTVKSRKRDQDGKPVGSSNPNPLLDSRKYLVCFEDGTEETYTANLIAEWLYLQIDDGERRLQAMQEIIHHKKNDSALRYDEAYYSTKTGLKPKRTTKGWRLLFEWKDGSSTWVRLADLKDAYPVQVADYATKKAFQTSRRSVGGSHLFLRKGSESSRKSRQSIGLSRIDFVQAIVLFDDALCSWTELTILVSKRFKRCPKSVSCSFEKFVSKSLIR